MEITSLANERVKLWASLLEKKGRDKAGAFIVEGPHLVMEALRACAGSFATYPTVHHLQIDCIVYRRESGIPEEVKEVYADLRPKKGNEPYQRSFDFPWIAVTDEIIAKCSDTMQPQGIFAVVHKPKPDADFLLEAPDALVLAADAVQDPGNLGTLIRSADAAGAEAVLIGRGSVDVYNPKAVRSTMGSLFHLPVIECDLPSILERAADAGAQIVTTSLDAEQTCYEMNFKRNTWFVVGNEAHGVSPSVDQQATHRIIIPMRGGAESLNVAMAATVLLFEAFRQRMES